MHKNIYSDKYPKKKEVTESIFSFSPYRQLYIPALLESSNTTKLNPDSQCYTFMHVTMSPSTYIISLNTRFFHKDSVNGRVMGVSAVGQRQWLQQLLRKSTLPSQLESNFSFLLSLAFCELDTSDL